MIAVPAGYKLVPLELTNIQAKAAWPHHYWIEGFLHWRVVDYAAMVKGYPTLAGFRYRHSEQEAWHYGLEPQSWWECKPVFETDADVNMLPQPSQELTFKWLDSTCAEQNRELMIKVKQRNDTLRALASWIKQLPFPTNGASAQLFHIDQLLGTDYTQERSVAKFQEPQE